VTYRTRTAINASAATPRRRGNRTTKRAVEQQIRCQRLRCISRRKLSATGDELPEHALRGVLRCFAAASTPMAADLVPA
jgi:hypothetical protein